MDADRSRPDEIDIQVGHIDAEAESCGQSDGGTGQPPQNTHLGLARKQEQDGDDRAVNLQTDGNHDGGRTRSDAEVDRESHADATLDEDVHLVFQDAGLNQDGAGEWIDDPLAGCVGGSNADQEVDAEGNDIERGADVERDIADGSRTKRNIGKREVVRDRRCCSRSRPRIRG